MYKNVKMLKALAWMKSANVKQMFGYVVPTWFGFGGWYYFNIRK